MKLTESSRRIKGSFEIALSKKKRTCKLCSKFGHDKRNCSLNLKRKKWNQLMKVSIELNLLNISFINIY